VSGRGRRFFRALRRLEATGRREQRIRDFCPVYASNKAPSDYVCSKCGDRQCKLWRQYQTFASHIHLLCIDCAAENQGKTIVDASPLGLVTMAASDGEPGYPSDSIGWLVPAVPLEDQRTFWGYTSVPAAGVAWWKRLPLRHGDEQNECCGECGGEGEIWVRYKGILPCPKCGAGAVAS
jgi:hypothetical protein